jgi:hypothetical protein
MYVEYLDQRKESVSVLIYPATYDWSRNNYVTQRRQIQIFSSIFQIKMNSDVADFVSRFHNLEGKTFEEKKKNLYFLMNDLPKNEDGLVAALVPSNHLEERFRVEILLKLERLPELLLILRSGKKCLISRVLRDKGFCKTVAELLDEYSAGFVDYIFAFMSYGSRISFISKLAIYGTTLDKLYDDLVVRYGFQIGSLLLLGCSATKIEEVMRTNKIKFSPKQLILLYEKHLPLFLLYLEQDHLNPDPNVLKYIVRRDIEDFLKVSERFFVVTSIGKRTTKKLLTSHKDLMVANAETFSFSLHMKSVAKVLNQDDFKSFYLNSFPKTVNCLENRPLDGFYKVRKCLGKRYYQLFKEGVEKTYNRSLYTLPYWVDDDLIAIMEPEEKQKWFQIKQDNSTETDLLKYLVPKHESIRAIKHKINAASTTESLEHLLELLLVVCKINNDLDLLAEVQEYVYSIQKDGDVNVTVSFSCKLKKHFDLEELGEAHWKFINLFVEVLHEKEVNLYGFLIRYLEFLFRNGRLNDEEICRQRKSIKSVFQGKSTKMDKNLEKFLLSRCVPLMPFLVENHEKLELYDLSLLNSILQWNKTHPTDQICVFDEPRLLESFRKSVLLAIDTDNFVEELEPLISILQNVICTREESTFRDEAIQSYFVLSRPFYNLTVDSWLLKYQPEAVTLNIDKFHDHLVSECDLNEERCECAITRRYRRQVEVARRLKHCEYLLRSKTVQYCIGKLRSHEANRNDGVNVEALFRILSMIMPPRRFVDLIGQFYFPAITSTPTKTKMEKHMTRVITTSTKCLADVTLIPVLLKRFRSQHLRNSFNHLCYELPEDQLTTFVGNLLWNDFAMTRQIIRLLFSVGNVQHVTSLIALFSTCEIDVHLHRGMYELLLKYLSKNPSDECWGNVKNYVEVLLHKHTNKSLVSVVFDVKRIPQKYQDAHVIFLWKEVKKNRGLSGGVRVLLSSITPELCQKLPLQFFLEVLSSDSFQGCQDSVSNYLRAVLRSTDRPNEVFAWIFHFVLLIKEGKIQFLDGRRSVAVISTFVSNFLKSVIGTDRNNRDIFNIFFKKWCDMFTVVETLDEFFQLAFASYYFNSGVRLLQLSPDLMHFVKGVAQKFGILVVQDFATGLKRALKHFHDCDDGSEEFFLFCLDLLRIADDLAGFNLVVNLLPAREPSRNGPKRLLWKIIQHLQEVPDETVEMLVNFYVLDMQGDPED